VERRGHQNINVIENNTLMDVQHQSINFVPPADQVGKDWSAGGGAQPGREPRPAVRLSGPAHRLIPIRRLRRLHHAGPGRGASNSTGLSSRSRMEPTAGPMDLSQVTSITFTIDVR